MKKVVLTMVLLSGFIATAQKGEGHKRHGNAMKDMTPEQVATLQTKKMTLALDLSEAQQEQMQQLNLENAKLRKTKMEERNAQKKEGKSEKPSSEERFEMHSERLDHKLAQQERVKQILTEEQFDQWKKMQHKRERHQRGAKTKGKGKKSK